LDKQEKGREAEYEQWPAEKEEEDATGGNGVIHVKEPQEGLLRLRDGVRSGKASWWPLSGFRVGGVY